MKATKTRVRHTTAKKMSHRDYKRCLHLNFGSRGMMRQTIYDARNDLAVPDIDIWYIRDDHRKIVAWALREPNWDVMFYVSKDYRRQGLGRQLLDAVTEAYGEDITAHPHDRASWGLLGPVMEYPPSSYDLCHIYEWPQP